MHMLEGAQPAGVAFLVHGKSPRGLTLTLRPFAVSAGEGYDIGTKHSFAMITASARGTLYKWSKEAFL